MKYIRTKMDKELSPLKAHKELKSRYGKYFSLQDDERAKVIEKSLKALEIIKKKTQYFIDFEEDTKTIYIDCALDCDNQEYTLLKEVLKDE